MKIRAALVILICGMLAATALLGPGRSGATVASGRSQDCHEVRHRRGQPAARRARRRPGARARRQCHRRRDCGQRGHGPRRARDERHRRRPVRDRVRSEDAKALRPERRRMGADGTDPRLAAIERPRLGAGERHLLGDGARRRRGMGRDARAVRRAADGGHPGAGDFLRRQRISRDRHHRSGMDRFDAGSWPRATPPRSCI